VQYLCSLIEEIYIVLKSIPILSVHLILELPNFLFPSVLPAKIFCALLNSDVLGTCPILLILLHYPKKYFKGLIIQSSPASLYLLHVRSICSLQNHILKPVICSMRNLSKLLISC